MEANRDESLRCIDLAKGLLRDGDTPRANKFLKKALRLCNTEEISSIVASVIASSQSTSRQNGSAGVHRNGGGQSDDETSKDFRGSRSRPSSPVYGQEGMRNRSTSRHRSTSAAQLHVDYAEEDLEAVQRILRSRDYYEILGLSKTFTEVELKKQYRKLALQFHPDKNRAPGATEAFKAIGNAYAVLSDPSKRERYDAYGHEDEAASSSAPGRRRRYADRDYTRGFEAEMTAEEIFHMFFGGAFPGHQVYRRDPFYYRAERAGDNRAHGDNNLGALIQLLPLLFVVLLTVVGQLLVPEQPFSLTKTGKYTEMRRTSQLGVTYYVQSDFVQQYKTRSSRLRVENQAEHEYIDNLKIACMREQSQRENMIWRASALGDQQMLSKAQSLSLPSCEKIQQIYG